MSKLTPKEVRYFYEIDQQIEILYEKKKKALSKVMQKKGPCQGYIKIEGEGIEKAFIRVVLKDNLEAFESGEPMYRNTAFNRFQADITALKNEPK